MVKSYAGGRVKFQTTVLSTTNGGFKGTRNERRFYNRSGYSVTTSISNISRKYLNQAHSITLTGRSYNKMWRDYDDA